ncbi:beta domain protein [Burkholderia pseudomallei]|nr:beta domain protein [Burkholderia pseudomallei]
MPLYTKTSAGATCRGLIFRWMMRGILSGDRVRILLDMSMPLPQYWLRTRRFRKTQVGALK